MNDSKQMACLVLVLFVAAAAGLAWWGTDTIRQTNTQTFAQTQGIISDSHYTSTRRKRTTTYHAHVTYHYTVAGTSYSSQRFAYSHEGPEGDDKDWVQAHPPGTAVTVYYNPASPDQSALRSGVFWQDFVVPAVMFAALFLTGGFLGCIWAEITRSRHALGFPVIQLSASRSAVSLTGDAAWPTAGAVGAVTVLAGTILHGISAPASVGVLLAGQAAIVLVSMLVAVGTFKLRRFFHARQKKWLVVDQAEQKLHIPASKSCDSATSLEFVQIQSCGIQRIEIRSGSRKHIRYQVSVTGQDSNAAFTSPVHAFANKLEAESLASWVEQQVGLRRAA